MVCGEQSTGNTSASLLRVVMVRLRVVLVRDRVVIVTDRVPVVMATSPECTSPTGQ